MAKAVAPPPVRWPGRPQLAAQAKVGQSRAVIQRAAAAAAVPVSSSAITASVEVIQGSVSEEILAELNRILQAAARAGGAASADPSGVLAKLTKFMSSEGMPKPGSQGTYAVGASSYFEGVMTMGTVGTASFGSAMEREAKTGHSVSQEDLGQRDSCVHGEVGLITAFPGFQAVLATQDCCLFCYGLLESRGYAHQKLRTAVWPQTGWTHDYMGFALRRVNLDIKPKGNIVAITWGSQTVYYRVDVGST